MQEPTQTSIPVPEQPFTPIPGYFVEGKRCSPCELIARYEWENAIRLRRFNKEEVITTPDHFSTERVETPAQREARLDEERAEKLRAEFTEKCIALSGGKEMTLQDLCRAMDFKYPVAMCSILKACHTASKVATFMLDSSGKTTVNFEDREPNQ